MQLRFGIVRGQSGGAAQYAHGIASAVERQIRLPQAIQAHGIPGTLRGGGFQVSQGLLGFAHLVVQAATRRMGRGEIRL